MSIDEADLVRRLHAVAERFDMPAVPPAEDVQRGRRRVRRNRATVAVAAAAVVAFVAVGGGLVTGALGGGDETRPAPIERPSTPSSPSLRLPERPLHMADFGRELDDILLQVRGWALNPRGAFPPDYDYAFNGVCAGRWGDEAESGSDGGPPPPGRNGAGFGHLGFATDAQASKAAARFVENLASCKAAAWQTRPLAYPGAVLAWSTHAVTWILHSDRDVRVLQVRTTDGPPPRPVQEAVAEWIFDYNKWQNES